MLKQTFRVYFVNFGYYSANEGTTLEEARKIAKKACFQSRIDCYSDEHPAGRTVGSFCPIGGFRYWDDNIHTREAPHA